MQHKVCALWQLQRMAVNGQKYVNGQSPGIFKAQDQERYIQSRIFVYMVTNLSALLYCWRDGNEPATENGEVAALVQLFQFSSMRVSNTAERKK